MFLVETWMAPDDPVVIGELKYYFGKMVFLTKAILYKVDSKKAK